MTEYIQIQGDRENNLQNVSLRIPKHQLTVFTGVSGSGKSSIVFDTIAQEAGRQLNSTFSSFARLFLPRYHRPDVDAVVNISPAVVIEQKPLGGNARSTLGTISDINPLLRLLFSRFGKPAHGHAANAFSFNDPEGMCPTCQGIGETYVLNEAAAFDRSQSLKAGAILLPGYVKNGYYNQQLLKTKRFDPDLPLEQWSDAQWHFFLQGDPDEAVRKKQKFEGVARQFFRTTTQADRDTSAGAAKRLAEFATQTLCPDCHAKRYNPGVLACKINRYNLFDLTDMQLSELTETLQSFDDPAMAPILADLQQRLGDMIAIGLDYLSLTRDTRSLSGGESQRVKTVQYLGNALTDMLYILDEPSTGLHPRDVHRLNDLLLKLRDNGNTVIVVEHDPDVIQVADHIIDMGPGAGTHGGTVTFTGTYAELLASDTLTGRSLKQSLPLNLHPRKPMAGNIESTPSRRHNLKNVALSVPRGLFTVVSGVAGSGKSTLVQQVFAAEHPEALVIDQSPLHANSRSSIATYTGIMDRLRQLFAKAFALPAGEFSSNSTGACPQCHGRGVVSLNLSFMDAVDVECSLCHGTKFKEAVLQYRLRGHNIVDMMQMTVEEAVSFFNDKKIAAKLAAVQNVGLDYLEIGQTLDTLSGGEAQRLKIAAELDHDGQLYILDEPTTGLHTADIANMIRIINDLVDAGNTVIVIEHNLDVIRSADWLIDIGPDGGTRGGEIVYAGPVAGVRECARSITGKYL